MGEPTFGDRLLKELSQAVAPGSDLSVLLNRALDDLIKATRAERGFVVLLATTGGSYSVAAARNIDAEDVRSPALKVSTTVIEQVIQGGEPILAERAVEDPRFAESESLKRLQTLSILCTPVRSGGRTAGVAYLDNRFLPHLFKDSEKALAVEFCVRLGRLLDQEPVPAAAPPKPAGGRSRDRFDRIIGRCDRMQEIYGLVEKFAPTSEPMVLYGESGTGKELAAQAIHAHSTRREAPFVAENCGAISPTLLEAELFGHVKGSFTGAIKDRPGLFERAHGGTLFLDEIASMSLEMQKSLLRALQNGEVRRVGGQDVRRVDVRLVVASNAPLADLVKAGAFREDLYYRLKVITIEMPPLRDRAEDIPLLVEHFLGGRRKVSDEAMRHLARFSWPGNVRQLENELRRAEILSEGTIEPKDLSPEVLNEAKSETQLPRSASLQQIERDAILGALQKTGWNKKRAAKILGIPRTTLYSKMKLLGIPDREPE